MDMYEAVMHDENDKFKMEHRLLAWQTSLLMNATGNFKKKITMESLVGKDDDDDADKDNSSGEVNRLDRDEKNRRLEALKNKFK